MRGQMNSFRVAALVTAALISDMQAASTADLLLRPRYAREQASDHKQQRDSNPIAKELLFQEFLEWLKKRGNTQRAASSALMQRTTSSVGR